VLTRQHGHTYVVGERDGLPAGNANHLLDGNARLLHHAYRLVAADDARPRVGGDSLGAEEVIEVGVTDDDPIARVDVAGREAGSGGVGRPIDVRVEEHGQAAGP
jgi:hypothetical protein